MRRARRPVRRVAVGPGDTPCVRVSSVDVRCRVRAPRLLPVLSLTCVSVYGFIHNTAYASCVFPEVSVVSLDRRDRCAKPKG